MRSAAWAIFGAACWRLTLYKWRYMLESLGFHDWQVHELMFLRWLAATARVHG